MISKNKQILKVTALYVIWNPKSVKCPASISENPVLLFELGNTEKCFGNYLIISACANKLGVEIETTLLTNAKFPILLLTHTGTD